MFKSAKAMKARSGKMVLVAGTNSAGRPRTFPEFARDHAAVFPGHHVTWRTRQRAAMEIGLRGRLRPDPAVVHVTFANAAVSEGVSINWIRLIAVMFAWRSVWR